MQSIWDCLLNSLSLGGAMALAVESSGLDWTILCCAVLMDDGPTGDIRIFNNGAGEKAQKITRAVSGLHGQ